MDQPLENRDLRRAMRDLLALATMPAAWVGRGPQQIADGLADLLVTTLRADAAYVRMPLLHQDPVEALRDSAPASDGAWVQLAQAEFAASGGGSHRSGTLAIPTPGGDLRVAFAPLGLDGAGGLVVAASRRIQFPAELDWLLLSVAANQAAVAFQTARLLAEKDRAEQEQRNHKRELQDFVENANVGLHWVGHDGTILWANKAELAMMGYSAEEYLGRPIAHFHVDQDCIADILARLRRGEELLDYPARVRCKDGSIREVLIRSSAYQENGRFVHTRCFTVDVTERRRAEQEQQKLAALVQHSPDFIGVADLEQRVVFLNAAAQNLAGIDEDEALRTKVLDYFPPDEREQVQNTIIPQLVAQGQWEGELNFQHFRTGERIPVSLNAFVIQDASTGKPAYMACVSRDIREQLRAQEALRRAEQLAATGKLAAVIAHEINNPIQALSNLMALVSYKTLEHPDIAPLVALAEEEIKRVGRITRQMLSFHRDSLHPVPCRVAEAIDDARELLALQRGGVASQVLVQVIDDCSVEAFPGQLRQLFLNLLSNALEASGQEGRVYVRVTRGREYGGRRRSGVRILVADNGPGISAEVRQRIFEPFVTTKAEKGTGLGLWVAQSIAHKHEGWLRVRSSTRPGRSGTTFCVFLPVASAAETPRLTAESAA